MRMGTNLEFNSNTEAIYTLIKQKYTLMNAYYLSEYDPINQKLMKTK